MKTGLLLGALPDGFQTCEENRDRDEDSFWNWGDPEYFENESSDRRKFSRLSIPVPCAIKHQGARFFFARIMDISFGGARIWGHYEGNQLKAVMKVRPLTEIDFTAFAFGISSVKSKVHEMRSRKGGFEMRVEFLSPSWAGGSVMDGMSPLIC
ncbi:MAG: PilZ domain-containing protein [Candidatus Lindowbacteria bacterium]|nr:PilZ domain-containing protein [Candidatus Lindowbacteria bacterium]